MLIRQYWRLMTMRSYCKRLRRTEKTIERQEVISSSNKETGYLQVLVYKLSKVGQAIENNDLPAASSVLGGTTDTDWVQKANTAFNKLTSSPEEKNEVDTFNSALASLITSVTRNDVESSKLAFVSSATAFEKWTTLSGTRWTAYRLSNLCHLWPILFLKFQLVLTI
ncbi:Thylakoid lumenal 16.5 kDa protein chloroplastic [Quillaja saponaria]|uniref:Thylakoid lumenal 16.5 kDa protein chloroplastic n=1 Tax=Quillaja saponaria TaxID=32244 RepID=A0AAD7VK70_QUISA|nr:Thylakoid lumenal 16.5 kDa protein chloroplastic [Quillaja saponaria]